MAAPSSKVSSRLASGLKRFQPIVETAKARDVNEADTVTIVKDFLSEVLGYDKYSDVTSEYSIKGTYVDLALKVEGKLRLLIEVKAVGQTLDDRHVKQAVDYAANEGVEWVLLTNAAEWRAYHVSFTKPIGTELVLTTDIMRLNHRRDVDLDVLFPLTKEGLSKSAVEQQHAQAEVTNRFVLAAILQSEPVLDVVRREIRRLNPNVKLETGDVAALLAGEVLKRDVVEGDAAIAARTKVKRAANRRLRVKEPGSETDNAPDAETPPPAPKAS